MERYTLRLAAVLLRGEDVLLLRRDNGAYYLPVLESDGGEGNVPLLEKELARLGWKGREAGFLGSAVDILGRGSAEEQEITTLYYLFSPAERGDESEVESRWMNRDKARGVLSAHDSLHLRKKFP